jgi:hypothetical protein
MSKVLIHPCSSLAVCAGAGLFATLIYVFSFFKTKAEIAILTAKQQDAELKVQTS